MKKILVATQKPFSKEAVDQIQAVAKSANYSIELFENYKTQEELIAKVDTADALIIRSDKVDQAVIEAAKNLKIVVRAGAGYDNVDLEAATANNVTVMNTPGQNANAVAELAFGMMILLIRNNYNGQAGTELKGKKLGIHAYGNIGKCVARIAKGFGMEIFVFDPFMDKSEIENDGLKTVNTVEELYTTCQYISIHIPANAQTKGSINYELLSKMPENSTLINTARKEVINEEELVKAMRDKPYLSYISDIAPDNADDFAEFDGRYFFTEKKMGAQTKEANLNAGVAAVKQIVDFLENGNAKYKVN